MSERTPGEPGPGMNLGDILYVVFRHKGKILILCGLAIAAAACAYIVIPRTYESDAKLYVRYVLESETPSQTSEPNDPRVRVPETRGDTIMNTEMEVLNNFSVAQDVARAIGPEKILGKGAGGEAGVDQAAVAISKSLSVEVPKNTSVLDLKFLSANPTIVQPVLQQIIEAYFKKHTAIHAVGALDEALTREIDERRTRLDQTREELEKAKEKLGVTSLADAEKNCNEQIAKLREQIINSEADLAEHEATLSALTKFLPGAVPALTNEPAATNSPAAVSAEKTSEYTRILSLVAALRQKEQELLLTYMPSSSPVREVREQIADLEKQKGRLETENRGLLAVRLPPTNQVSAGTSGLPLDLETETARVSALRSRVKALKDSLAGVQTRAATLNEAEGRITELQTRLDLQEAQYKRFSEKQDQSKTEERLGAGRVFNISIIQAPSPPLGAPSKRLKIIAGIFLGGLGAAFGLAFLIEFYLDRSLRRPAEVESKLHLPLFLSIPELRLNGRNLSLPPGKGRALLTAGEAPFENGEVEQRPSLRREPGSGPGEMEIAPWDPKHALRPFLETLRDRLVAFFEMKNMTHKPKLVAVTSCGERAGVSTVAAGLAASLSETGEGNVLLVDMNVQNGAARHFARGDLAYGLDEALEAAKRGDAMVQDNLYVVSESAGGDKLPGVLPKRFKSLVPKLKASDYDYILFDMPPVSQISLTPRLARFMDVVLMVVESEKTDVNVIQRASALLAESKTNVGVVLNKNRSYVPRSLQSQF
ncbi:MAG TPA: hypothetical protein VG167_06490 [Verrucomicrobiae bacterium]|nr:hypothetical protein [Verrucomicrobiae bacterium]